MRKHFSIGVLSALAAALCVAQSARAGIVDFNDLTFPGTYNLYYNDVWDEGLHFQDDGFAAMTPGANVHPIGQASQFMEAGNYAQLEPLTITSYTGTPRANDNSTPQGPDYVDGNAFNVWYLKIGLGDGNRGATDMVTIQGTSAPGCAGALCNPTMTIAVTGHFQLIALDGFTDLTSLTINQQLTPGGTRDIGWLGFDDISYTAFDPNGSNPPGERPSPVPAGDVPEPSAWALMIVGFGGIGAILRRNRRQDLAAA